jgi:hypothetical protein
MKITVPMPQEGTRRARKVFALIPTYFHHGSNNEPLRTMVWLDYYYIQEQYQYGRWRYNERMLDEPSKQHFGVEE